jgi:predicted dienelactone hydrolase
VTFRRWGTPGAFLVPALSVYILLTLAACSSPDDLKGELVDPSRDRILKYQLWLPPVDVSAGPSPLILLSHGSGGEYSNHQWLIDALVAHGYSVAAVNHPGDTTRDASDGGVIRVWDRPRDLSLLLDHLLADPQWSPRLDKKRIAATGFSSGGYTVIALAGAIYDPALMAAYCEGPKRGPDCDLAKSTTGIDFSESSMSYKDERIKAVFAMAPAVGSAITPSSLEAISLPVFITAAQDDEVLWPSTSAQRYAQYIPNAELDLLPAGGHFIFLECNFLAAIADLLIEEFDLCGRQFSVDRPQARAAVADEAVRFFGRILQ